MVACCHITENLFDILRNGQRTVTSELMDVVLQALDTVNAQFAAVSARQEAMPASPELIARLERLVSCADLSEPAPVAAALYLRLPLQLRLPLRLSLLCQPHPPVHHPVNPQPAALI